MGAEYRPTEEWPLVWVKNKPGGGVEVLRAADPADPTREVPADLWPCLSRILLALLDFRFFHPQGPHSTCTHLLKVASHCSYLMGGIAATVKLC